MLFALKVRCLEVTCLGNSTSDFPARKVGAPRADTSRHDSSLTDSNTLWLERQTSSFVIHLHPPHSSVTSSEFCSYCCSHQLRKAKKARATENEISMLELMHASLCTLTDATLLYRNQPQVYSNKRRNFLE